MAMCVCVLISVEAAIPIAFLLACTGSLISKLSCLAVIISVTKEGVKFSTGGDIGNANIVCRQNTAVDKVRNRCSHFLCLTIEALERVGTVIWISVLHCLWYFLSLA